LTGLSVAVVLLSGWIGPGAEREAEPLWLTLPVAVVLVLVPLAAVAAVARWMRRLSQRWTGGWPVAAWFDLRHALALFPLLAVGLVAGVVWASSAVTVGVGYREPRRAHDSWEGSVVVGVWAGLAVAVVGAVLVALGTGLARERMGAVAGLAIVPLAGIAGGIVVASVGAGGVDGVVARVLVGSVVPYLLLMASLALAVRRRRRGRAVATTAA
jgi:hypothetical protein